MTYGIICEELARVDWVVASVVSVTNSLVAGSILRHGSEAQKERWLPRVARGEILSSACLTEPGGGTDLGNLKSTATRVAGGWRLDGTKVFISHAAHAGLFLVVASIDLAQKHGGVTAFLVDPHERGHRHRRVPDAHAQARQPGRGPLRERLRARRRACSASRAAASRCSARRSTWGAISVAARCLGQAQRCIDLAVAYATPARGLRPEDRRVPDDPAEDRRHGVPHRGRARRRLPARAHEGRGHRSAPASRRRSRS